MTKKKMTIEEAMTELNSCVEYYDMVHDTGDEKTTAANKDRAWKALERVGEDLLNEKN